MLNINPYLTFNGECEEAFNFYKSVFGAEFTHFSRFKDMPSEHTIPDNQAGKILHVSLPIGPNTYLMGSDSMGGQHQVKTGDNIAISINTETEEQATRYFNGLSEGGIVTMPMEKTFWNAWFGMFTDRFGINWMVNYDYN